MDKGLTLIEAVKNCSYEKKWEYTRDIASGILYLHNNNFVHGDLKSLNIIVTGFGNKGGVAKIADFGFVHRFYQKTKEAYGTMFCRAPEWFIEEEEIDLFEEKNVKYVQQHKNSFLAESWCLGMIISEIFEGKYLLSRNGWDNKDKVSSGIIKELNNYINNPYDYVIQGKYGKDSDEIIPLIIALAHPDFSKRMSIAALFEDKSFTSRGFTYEKILMKRTRDLSIFSNLTEDQLQTIEIVIEWMGEVYGERSMSGLSKKSFFQGCELFYYSFHLDENYPKNLQTLACSCIVVASSLCDKTTASIDKLKYFTANTSTEEDITKYFKLIVENVTLLQDTLYDKIYDRPQLVDKAKKIILDPALFVSKTIDEHAKDLAKKD